MEFSRQPQLDAVTAELQKHVEVGQLLRTAIRTHSAQASHLEGLYAEVDKLTKGKSLVPTSDLLVEVVNALISDAKGLIRKDTYLDRVKTFVAAGDNPAYPDVLVVLRVLQQSMERFDLMLKSEAAGHAQIGSELKSIRAALEVAEQDESDFDESSDPDDTGEEDAEQHEEAQQDIEEPDTGDEAEDEEGEDNGNEEEDGLEEEYQEYVRKSEVRSRLNEESVSANWFRREGAEEVFDFRKLDDSAIPSYVPPSEGITFNKTDR